MNVPIGYVVTLLCCLGGFAIAGGHISVLVQPVEFLIIAGASLGTLISSNNSTTLKSVISALPRAFTAPETNKRLSLDLLCLLFEILNKSRRDGIMSIEGDIEEPANSAIFSKYPSIVSNHHLVDFLTDYLRMMLGGSLNVVQIETLMEKELEVHHHEELRAATVIQRMADGLPAFGIVAAVMGVVHTMGSVGLPPAELGKLIGAALVGTFLGILISYAFVGPLASLLEQRLEAESKYYEATKSVLLAYMNGFPPQVAVEFGRKILFSEAKPGFKELEDETRAVRGR